MVNEQTMEMIERLKLLALKRCEERIQNASGSSYPKLPDRSTHAHCYGVTAMLRHRHGI